MEQRLWAEEAWGEVLAGGEAAKDQVLLCWGHLMEVLAGVLVHDRVHVETDQRGDLLLQPLRNPTLRGSSFNQTDFYYMIGRALDPTDYDSRTSRRSILMLLMRFLPHLDKHGDRFSSDFTRVANDERRHFGWQQKMFELGFRYQQSVGEVKTVVDMHERKSEMAKHVVAFIALPGGYGTMEVFFSAQV